MTDLLGILTALLLAAQAQVADETAAVGTAEAEAPQAEQVASVQSAQDPEATEADDDDKIICRRTAIIGSKFKKRICGTKKQWETLANRGTETTRELQRRGKGLEPEDVGGP